jgi:hypothetical protein
LDPEGTTIIETVFSKSDIWGLDIRNRKEAIDFSSSSSKTWPCP